MHLAQLSFCPGRAAAAGSEGREPAHYCILHHTQPLLHQLTVKLSTLMPCRIAKTPCTCCVPGGQHATPHLYSLIAIATPTAIKSNRAALPMESKCTLRRDDVDTYNPGPAVIFGNTSALKGD